VKKIPVKSENFEPYYIGKYKVYRFERKKGRVKNTCPVHPPGA
jgi:hypothetical protein